MKRNPASSSLRLPYTYVFINQSRVSTNLQYGDTPLHYATFCGQETLVNLLLQAGADSAAIGADGRTPLAMAMEEGHQAVAVVLSDHAGKERGASESKLKELHDRDGGGKSRDSAVAYMRNVLQLGDAAFAGDVRAVASFIKAGVDVNGADSDGFSALHRAATAGSLHVMDLLLAQGADPNAKDSAGCTPLHYAAFCGLTDAAHLLIAGGADPQRRNRDGLTPADVAKAEGKTTVHKLLTGTWTKVENLEFGHGVVLEGELKAKRSGDSLGSGLFKWRVKYVVLSRHYRALFAWAGSATHVDGPVTRLKLDNVDTVLHDAKAVGTHDALRGCRPVCLLTLSYPPKIRPLRQRRDRLMSVDRVSV